MRRVEDEQLHRRNDRENGRQRSCDLLDAAACLANEGVLGNDHVGGIGITHEALLVVRELGDLAQRFLHILATHGASGAVA